MEAIERRCTCGGTLVLASAVGHELRLQLNLLPVGEVSQGRVLQFVCPACKEVVQLLDSTRRGWFLYPVVLSAVALGVALWLRGAAGVLLASAALALGVPFAAFVVADTRKRARHPAVE